jgi:pimeloyl-ACP methyl ester carboxylesterase
LEHIVARTPLVFVPGLLCDALQWQPQIAGLGDIADCWVADAASADTMAGIAANILAACPFARFALAGLSMGGYVALELMRQAPERITALGLLDTTARPDTQEQTARRLAFIELAERGRFAGVTDTLIPFLVHRDRVRDSALTSIIRTMARNLGKSAFIRQERAIMSRIDSRPLLAQIRCPTIVLCGKEDQLTPPDRHEEMAAAIPGAKLVIIERSGHLSTLEQGDAVNGELRRWLQAGS